MHRAESPMRRGSMKRSKRVSSHGDLRIGQSVEMVDGPLTGLTGVIVAVMPIRLCVSVTLLQREIVVEMESEWVCALQLSGSGSNINFLFRCFMLREHYEALIGDLQEGITAKSKTS